MTQQSEASMVMADDALNECEEYFKQRADAEYFADCPSPTGNEEMQLLILVQNAREAIARAAATPREIEHGED